MPFTRAPKRPRVGGTDCIFPRGVEERFGVTSATRYRWEKSGKLPPRDVNVGGKAVEWRPATIHAAERGEYRGPTATPPITVPEKCR
jgi:predicted DNA-binding transcriptional regulator AlpA